MKVLVPAKLSPGHGPGEVIAELGAACSAFIDSSFVVGTLPAQPSQNGTIIAYLVRVDDGRALVELPGVAIGALRGWVSTWSAA